MQPFTAIRVRGVTNWHLELSFAAWMGWGTRYYWLRAIHRPVIVCMYEYNILESLFGEEKKEPKSEQIKF